jgi:hypothetical protein
MQRTLMNILTSNQAPDLSASLLFGARHFSGTVSSIQAAGKRRQHLHFWSIRCATGADRGGDTTRILSPSNVRYGTSLRRFVGYWDYNGQKSTPSVYG